jgi:hypothetical protein
MNNMKIINFLVGISVLVFILNSCGKEPVENPCECGQKPVSANFTIMEKYYVDQFLNDVYTPYDTDTVFSNYVQFKALEDDAIYTWQIGIETLDTKDVERSGFPKGQLIPITLIVEKIPDNDCFPDDDGRDTLTRYLYRMESNCESLIHGQFHGALASNPQDTFTIDIDNCAPYPINLSSSYYPYFNNLKRDCEFACKERIIGYKQIGFHAGDSQCDHIYGLAKINNNNEITIEFSYRTGEYMDVEYIFNGLKK